MSHKEKNEFGLPDVDNTPMGIIGMEGRFYRGLADNHHRPWWVRMLSILMGLFLTGIGAVLIGVGIVAAREQLINIFNAVVGLLFLAVGIKIIFANLRGPKV